MKNTSNTSRELFLENTNVSRETIESLDRLVGLVDKWSQKINLIALNTRENIWERHVMDSAQLLAASGRTGGKWLDIGSGGGFPGLVIAILAGDSQPGFQVTLVESNTRKCVFLQTAIRELGIPASVENTRIEALSPHGADVISARAVAPLPRLLELAIPHLADGGVCLFPKGRNHISELTETGQSWKLSYDLRQSRTDPQAAILRIYEATRV